MKIKILKAVVSDVNKIKKYWLRLFGILLTDKQVVDYSISTVQNIPLEVLKAMDLYKDVLSSKNIQLSRPIEDIIKRHKLRLGIPKIQDNVIVAAAIKLRAATIAHQYGKLKLLKAGMAIDNLNSEKKKAVFYTTNYAANKVIL